MSAIVLTGSKQEIMEQIAQISFAIQKVVVLVDKSVRPASDPPKPGEDIFAEMEPYMSDATDVDWSREAIYTPMEGEE